MRTVYLRSLVTAVLALFCVVDFAAAAADPVPANPSAIYRKISPATVTILTYTNVGDKEPVSQGSGVIVHADGYVATNFHVVEGGRQ